MTKSVAAPRLTEGNHLTLQFAPEQIELVERAASVRGQTMLEFTLTTVLEAACRTINEDSRLDLSVADTQAFIEALLAPQPVGDRLHDTVSQYRRVMGI